jgi:hypothetical protein
MTHVASEVPRGKSLQGNYSTVIWIGQRAFDRAAGPGRTDVLTHRR